MGEAKRRKKAKSTGVVPSVFTTRKTSMSAINKRLKLRGFDSKIIDMGTPFKSGKIHVAKGETLPHTVAVIGDIQKEITGESRAK